MNFSSDHQERDRQPLAGGPVASAVNKPTNQPIAVALALKIEQQQTLPPSYNTVVLLQKSSFPRQHMPLFTFASCLGLGRTKVLYDLSAAVPKNSSASVNPLGSTPTISSACTDRRTTECYRRNSETRCPSVFGNAGVKGQLPRWRVHCLLDPKIHFPILNTHPGVSVADGASTTFGATAESINEFGAPWFITPSKFSSP